MIEENDASNDKASETDFQWSDNRRGQPRYPLNVPVEFTLEDAPQVVVERGVGRDIGLGGARIMPPKAAQGRIQVGARVRLRLTVERINESLELAGTVVHIDPQRGFGIQFEALPREIRMRLKRLLTELAKTH